MIRPMARNPSANDPLYRRVANSIEQQIGHGVLRVGDKVPSIRAFSRHHRVSISTALQAYFWLEHRGYIEPRPRSGFYVRVPFTQLIQEPKHQELRVVPTVVGTATIIHEVVRIAAEPSMVPLGAAFPGPDVLATGMLNRSVRSIVKRLPSHSVTYDLPEATDLFRRQIARQSLSHGCNFSPDDILATCGALEALNLCLRAVAKPNEVIAIESPTYFGVLQAIQSLGMRAVEIPTLPQAGMRLEALEEAIRKHSVKACVVMPNCQNPMGYVVPDALKRRFVKLTSRYEIPVIEDDVYGDLAFAGRARTLKSFDQHGLVLLCSSFSKVLAPGLRIGWVHAGKFRFEVERLKYVTTIASPTLAQLAVADCLQSGRYERYIRKLRQTFYDQVQSASNAVAKYFPEGTRITRPRGGYLLWIELPKRVDAFRVYREALQKNVSILPGTIFSPSGRFGNHIRISCNHPWSNTMDLAIETLGHICKAAL
jgi:DNA-binding transcriptional MocR family regulator